MYLSNQVSTQSDVSYQQGDGWLWVTAHRTGEQGLVFRDLLADLEENIDPNAVFPWFHPNLTKNEAVEMLVRGNFSHGFPRDLVQFYSSNEWGLFNCIRGCVHITYTLWMGGWVAKYSTQPYRVGSSSKYILHTLRVYLF